MEQNLTEAVNPMDQKLAKAVDQMEQKLSKLNLVWLYPVEKYPIEPMLMASRIVEL